jgi:hypothetical protein
MDLLKGFMDLTTKLIDEFSQARQDRVYLEQAHRTELAEVKQSH